MSTSDPDKDRGGGCPPFRESSSTPPPTPDQISLSYAKAMGGASGGTNQLKKYAEIVALQKTQRNVLEVKIKKNPKVEQGG